MEKEEEYSSKHKYRGIAVIICNAEFKGYGYREGAVKDKEKLEKTFNDLGFIVQSHLNLTATQMLAAVDEASKDKRNIDADCFVCVISSHGDPYPVELGHDSKNNWYLNTEVLHGTDQFISLKLLIDPVREDVCKALANKPKLFFIQACRGGKTSEVVTVVPAQGNGCTLRPLGGATHNRDSTASLDLQESDATDLTKLREDTGDKSPDAEIATKQKLSSLQTDGNHSVKPMSKKHRRNIKIQDIPIQSHFLLAWAVQPGFVAFHRPSGSWFIKGLCRMLDRHHTDSDLLTIMTKVNEYVAQKYESNCPKDASLNAKKMMPWTAHQLTKDVFFKNKN